LWCSCACTCTRTSTCTARTPSLRTARRAPAPRLAAVAPPPRRHGADGADGGVQMAGVLPSLVMLLESVGLIFQIPPDEPIGDESEGGDSVGWGGAAAARGGAGGVGGGAAGRAGDTGARGRGLPRREREESLEAKAPARGTRGGGWRPRVLFIVRKYGADDAPQHGLDRCALPLRKAMPSPHLPHTPCPPRGVEALGSARGRLQACEGRGGGGMVGDGAGGGGAAAARRGWGRALYKGPPGAA